MRQILTVPLLLLLVACHATPRAARMAPERLWYSIDSEQSVQRFLQHADQVDIVSPQSFAMDSMGIVTGAIDARVAERARAAGVKLIPLVVNPGFDQGIFHRVLVSPERRSVAARNLAALCREQRFDGIQFDFENVAITDRDLFSAFAREVADSLRRVPCSLSAAVVPRTSEDPGPTSYSQWMHANWRGAYDYKALADVMDFLSLMTYSQHTRRTPPGPVAGYPWMEASVKHLIALGVPPSKISLGLPAYSQSWHAVYDTVNGARSTGSGLTHETALSIIAGHGATARWDPTQMESVATWEHGGVNEWLYLQDRRAFEARLALIEKYGLRGYSVWRIGQEDQGVWTLDGVRRRR